MNRKPLLPALGRWLIRVTPIPRERRQEVLADLEELFAGRNAAHGIRYAKRRFYRDLLSLWRVRTTDPPKYLWRRPGAFWRGTATDLQYASRLFARRPAILMLTILGLALGLGVATATFSFMNAAVLRGDGVPDPERVPKVLRITNRSTSTVWPYDEFLRLREGAALIQVEAVLSDGAQFRTAPGTDDAPLAGVAFVSGSFFQVMGGRPALGRTLLPADERYAAAPPVVVSHGFWVRRLDRDPSAVGRTVWIGRTAATLVGVMERSFAAPANRNTAMWMPIAAYSPVYDPAPAGRGFDRAVEVAGRLAPEVTLAEAEAQLSAVAASLPVRQAEPDAGLRVRLDPDARLGRGSSAQTTALVTSVSMVIALVLLLACANVATVLIATAIPREREMGVRSALGASRWRILRQLLTESLALGAVAGGLGLAMAFWAMSVIPSMLRVPEGVDLAPDLNVYLFLLVATLLVGVGAGLAPAWHGRGADLLSPLKGEGANPRRVGPKRLRSLLVLVQTAASVLLVVLATLFVRATWRASQIDVGFDARHLYAVSAGLGRAAADNDGAGIKAYWARAIEDLSALPGVAGVSLAEHPPFGNSIRTSSREAGGSRIVIYLNRTRSNYFDTVGLRITQGRHYSPAEVAADAPVAVVSESVARLYWSGTSPLGSTLQRVDSSSRAIIIGVVADAITADLHRRSASGIYQPLAPKNELFGRLIVRIQPGADGVPQQAREVLHRIDPQANVQVISLGDRLQSEIDRPGILATLASIVGTIAIALCVIGMYGLTASIVAQRTNEIGVRIALGAEPRDVTRLLVRDSLRPVAAGVLAGGAAALLAGQAIAGVLYGVSPRDPFAFLAAAVLLLGAAGTATILPARRAASVDPAFVLRQS